MPILFIVLALFMSLLAALFVFIPAQRSARANGQSWQVTCGIFALIIVAGTAAFYGLTSRWSWTPDGVPDSPASQQLYQLQKAVHVNDHDAGAWARLGSFYLRFGQIPSAIDALEKSMQLSQGRDIDTNLNLVEALSSRNAPNDQARSAQILDASLKQDPGHRKALWYGGEIAASLGQWDIAIARWRVMLEDSRLINTQEAQSVTRLLQERIDSAEREREKNDSSVAHSGDSGNRPEAVRIRVSLTNDLAQTPALTPSTNVFVFVRAKEQMGPPLAVHRATVGQLPLDVVLSDDNAMMPGRTMSAFDELEIVARVSLGGAPTMTPGDLFGQKTVIAGESRDVQIAIDQVAVGP